MRLRIRVSIAGKKEKGVMLVNRKHTSCENENAKEERIEKVTHREVRLKFVVDCGCCLIRRCDRSAASGMRSQSSALVTINGGPRGNTKGVSRREGRRCCVYPGSSPSSLVSGREMYKVGETK
jgi:hypothetical protein